MNNQYRSLFAVGGFAILLWLAAAIGWLMNAWKLISLLLNSGFAGHETEAIVRGVGAIVAPLGAVAGYF